QNENHQEKLRARLNPYDPANGYNPNGLSTYSDAFKKRYFAAQSDRLNKLIAEAQDIQFHMDQGAYPYPDDAPFVIGRSVASKLFVLDTSILHGTLKPQK